MTLTFREPRVDVPVDLEAHLKLLPAGASCKGMFVRDVLALASKHATAEQIATRAGVKVRRYLPFSDYPMTENYKIIIEAAKLMNPAQPVSVSLRALGRTGFRTFLSSTAARVLMAVAGASEVDKVFMLTPKSYAMSINYGRVDVTRVSERCIHITLADYPSFLETYQVGIFEGVFDHFHVQGHVRIALIDLANAVIEVAW